MDLRSMLAILSLVIGHWSLVIGHSSFVPESWHLVGAGLVTSG
ncbi:hypothetical protein [Coleofasciculus sp. F4-SAH-05]